MPPEDVLDREPEQPEVPDKGQGKDEVTIGKSELESLRRERDEAIQGNRDWASYIRHGGPPQQPQRAGPEPEDEEDLDPAQFIDPDGFIDVAGDTPEKLVDDLATQGVAALGKRGFITAADAQKMAVEVASKVTRELISRERGRMQSDAQIFAEFPDLKDQKSELWQETAKRYQKAVAMDSAAKRTPAALYLAADAAKEFLRARNGGKRGRDDDADAEPDSAHGSREDESDRRRRADSQDSRPRGRAAADDTDDMLGSEARAVIKGMGITEADYNASRRELAGIGRGGRRR